MWLDADNTTVKRITRLKSNVQSAFNTNWCRTQEHKIEIEVGTDTDCLFWLVNRFSSTGRSVAYVAVCGWPLTYGCAQRPSSTCAPSALTATWPSRGHSDTLSSCHRRGLDCSSSASGFFLLSSAFLRSSDGTIQIKVGLELPVFLEQIGRRTLGLVVSHFTAFRLRRS